MFTELDAIRKEAQEAHAQQDYLIAEEHYRTLLKEEGEPERRNQSRRITADPKAG